MLVLILPLVGLARRIDSWRVRVPAGALSIGTCIHPRTVIVPTSRRRIALRDPDLLRLGPQAHRPADRTGRGRNPGSRPKWGTAPPSRQPPMSEARPLPVRAGDQERGWPAASASATARSVRSQVKSGSSRPKCPNTAVGR